MAKFGCIKAVVFGTALQQLVFSALGWVNLLPPWGKSFVEDYSRSGDHESFTNLESNALQAALICFEMFIFALIHKSVFSWRDFAVDQFDERGNPLGPAIGISTAFQNMIDVGDILGESEFFVKSRSKQAVQDVERVPLIGHVVKGVHYGVTGENARVHGMLGT